MIVGQRERELPVDELAAGARELGPSVAPRRDALEPAEEMPRVTRS